MSAYLLPKELQYSDGTPYTQFQVVTAKPQQGVLDTLKKLREACRGTWAEKILAQRIYERMHATLSKKNVSSCTYMAQQCNPYSEPYKIERLYNLIINEERETCFRCATFQEARKQFQMAVEPCLLESGEFTKEFLDAREMGANQVVNGIFLGCDRGFLGTTGLDYRVVLVNVRTTNPNQFKTIISLCSLEQSLNRFFPERVKEESVGLSDHYAREHIKWLRLGEEVNDKRGDWYSLLHAGTFIGTQKSSKEDKEALMLKTPFDQWLEPVFQELDRGFKNEHRVLIHCRMGISRSATVLILYFIKRLGLNPTQVEAALRNYRLCVNPNFRPEITDFYTRLLESRRGLPANQ